MDRIEASAYSRDVPDYKQMEDGEQDDGVLIPRGLTRGR